MRSWNLTNGTVGELRGLIANITSGATLKIDGKDAVLLEKESDTVHLRSKGNGAAVVPDSPPPAKADEPKPDREGTDEEETPEPPADLAIGEIRHDAGPMYWVGMPDHVLRVKGKKQAKKVLEDAGL